MASYHGKTQTSSEVIFKQLDVPNVAGRDLLILDDILESGTHVGGRSQKAGEGQTAQHSGLCAAEQK